MLKYVLIVGTLYCIILLMFSLITRKKAKNSDNYLMAGSNLSAILGFFTFAATLFSTFTILGMPDFFRVHGVGAWIFLAVSDAVMVFLVIWLGTHFRKRSSGHKYYGMSGFMKHVYQSRLAGFITFFGGFIFLIPYVAIQIRGVAIFLNAAFPDFLPMWAWATGMVCIILFYSEVGGLKAIIYNDVFQGILLLLVIWIIGVSCLVAAGGMENLFHKVGETNLALLSTPGPKGLFDFQFLLGSMIAIALIPFTQPQVSTRLIIMRNQNALYRMAIGIGFFAILIIFPTMIMGMYGAIHHPDATTSQFLGGILIDDQTHLMGAFVMIGLMAAAISTSDSQLFALGSEIRSLLTTEDKKALLTARVCIVLFATISLIFSLISGDELVMLARTSFAGTAIMGPMIFTAIFNRQASNMKWLPWLTFVGLILFISTQLGWVPNNLAGVSSELLILGILGIAALSGAVPSSLLKISSK